MKREWRIIRSLNIWNSTTRRRMKRNVSVSLTKSSWNISVRARTLKKRHPGSSATRSSSVPSSDRPATVPILDPDPLEVTHPPESLARHLNLLALAPFLSTVSLRKAKKPRRKYFSRFIVIFSYSTSCSLEFIKSPLRY